MSSTAKRFFNNNWDQPLFSNLTLEQKLLYKYLWERSDIAGVYVLNYPVMSAYVGYEVNEEIVQELVGALNNEMEIVNEQVTWFKDFVRFQQKETGGPLSAASPPHKSSVKQLKKAGIFEIAYLNDPELYSNYPNPTLSQPLLKSYSNSNSSGSGSGNSSSNGSNSTSYILSKSIAERLCVTEGLSLQEIVSEVNSIALELDNDSSFMGDPFSHIDYILSQMEAYYTKSELTIGALKEKIGSTQS